MSNPSLASPPTQGSWNGQTLRTIALGTILILLVALAFWLLITLRNVLLIFFLGVFIATSLRAVVDWLRRFNIPRPIAAGATVLLVVALAALLLAATLPAIFGQASMLAQELPAFYDNLRAALIQSPYAVVRAFGSSLAPSLPITADSFLPSLVQQALGWLPVAGSGLFVTFSALLLTFYWLLYRERSVRGMLLLLPMASREDVEALWLQIEAKIGAFLRSQLLLMLTVGLASLLGYWLIGLPYALLLALAAGLLEIVPFIGPILSTALAVGVGMSVSLPLGAGALIVGLVVHQLENNILAPRIVNHILGVNPVVTLLALVGFTALFGLAGTLLAIPLAAVFQVLFNYWLAHRTGAPGDDEIEGRNMAARLRYELRDLAQDVRSHVRRKDDQVDREVDQTEEELEQILLSLDTLLKQDEL